MLYGVVLAGGASRRMGRDKALMQFNGRTLISHAAHLLEAAGCERVVVSRNKDGYIADKIDDVGPLGGVHAVISEIMNGVSQTRLNDEISKIYEAELLVLPVDMPQMTPQFLSRLIALGRQHQQACYVENRFLPFYLPVNTNTLTVLNAYLIDQGKRRVVGFLEQVNALVLSSLSCENEAQWLNVNSPSDWPTSQ